MAAEWMDEDTNNGGARAGAPAPLALAPHWVWNAVAYLPALVGAPTLALGVAGLLGRGPRILRENWLLSGLTAVSGVAILTKWQLDRFFHESPEYELEEELNGFEIRRYAPRVVAETVVTGVTDFKAAREEGFRRLAGYIFGDSTRHETAMATSESALSEAAAGERIPMTTPVTSRSSSTGYVVTFTMPRNRRLSNLPAPIDPRVRLRKTRAERVAVLHFRGSYDSEHVEEKEAELLFRVRAAGLTPRGEPYFAGYDSPSTLALLRHSEIWMRIAD